MWSVDDPENADTIRLVASNPAADRLMNRDLGAFRGKSLGDVRPKGRGGQYESLILEVARDGKVREASTLESRNPIDRTRAVFIKAFPLPGKNVGTAVEDVTTQTLTRKLQEAEQHVLASLAEGAPLVDVLGDLVRAVEAHSPPAIGAIHLRDTDGDVYPERVSPSFEGEPQSLHVYASEPILARDDCDLGDFVLYMREPRRLSDEDQAVLERAANLARIAIERRQLEDQLRELRARGERARGRADRDRARDRRRAGAGAHGGEDGHRVDCAALVVGRGDREGRAPGEAVGDVEDGRRDYRPGAPHLRRAAPRRARRPRARGRD